VSILGQSTGIVKKEAASKFSRLRERGTDIGQKRADAGHRRERDFIRQQKKNPHLPEAADVGLPGQVHELKLSG
jgi:hypothetical protein